MKLVQAVVFVFLMLFGSLVVADAAPGEQAVGQVIFSTGGGTLQFESGTQVKGEAGTPVYVGQTLSTGTGSHMHVQMIDGALLMLRPTSSLRIAYYTVDLAHPANTKILLDMQKGVIRSVTGKGGQTNKQGFRFNTPVAAIGIKGTDFTVLANANLSSIDLRQGGVVVSPFSAMCPRYAVGACSGGETVMLTATDQQMLAEVRAAKAVRVSKANAAAVVPDNVAPAHPTEEKSVQDAKASPAISSTNSSVNTAVASTTQSSIQQQAVNANVSSNASAGSNSSAATVTGTSKSASTAESATTASGLVVSNGAVDEKSKVPADTKLTAVSSSDGVVKNTQQSGSTAEVASLSPVSAEVGPKGSVTSELASRIVAEKTLENTTNTVLAPAPVVPAPVVIAEALPAKPQPFYWGRWAGYAENPEQIIVRDPVKNKQIFTANQVYLLADGEAGAPQLPKSGTVTFALDKGEAGVVSGSNLLPASISAASLEANFDNNRFKTGLTVNSAALKDGSVALTAEGSLLPDAGTFRSSSVNSTMNVSGAFSDGAAHAAYEFNDPKSNVVGATSWNH